MPVNLTVEQLLLINLLLRIAVMAGITSLVLSFRFATDFLMRVSVSVVDRLRMIALLGSIFVIGIVVRKLTYQGAMDLSLEGALFAGFLGGVWVGTGVGVAIGVACYLFGEVVALPYYVLAGFMSGGLVTLLRARGEIWSYSLNPFSIIWSFFEGLFKKRLDRSFIPFALGLMFVAVRYDLIRRFAAQNRFYGYMQPDTFFIVLDVVVLVFTLGIALKIASNMRLELRLREEERQLVHARLVTLRSQINPHFLFNTLNSISALIRTDAEKAREMTHRLASIFRKSLDDSAETHALRDEIAFIDDYLSIERVRFGDDKLRVAKAISDDALGFPIPIMMLQPLVENAIKHGISKKVEGGSLRIGARLAGAGIEIEIENDGPPLGACRLGELMERGLGLRNVIERLQICSCGEGRFEIAPRVGGGATVRLYMPLGGARKVEQCLSER